MARDVIIHQINDWSVLNSKDDVWNKIDLSTPEINFGIHKFQGRLWSSGYVGVGRLHDKNGRYLQSAGKEHIVVVTSQYGMEPWHMLETVMTDDEYDDYIAEMEAEGRSLFHVFYDQPLIKLSQDIEQDGELLYALSFITSCYGLCKKGLKKTMFHQEENYSSKVRGKIEIKKNIRMNTCKGRNDRFYCKYIHLMPYCIPDIIIRDNETQNPVAVIDAKYKPNTRSVRADTHQLLSYVLLTGVKKCGFAFPGAESKAKIMRSTETAALPLSVNAINYYELIFGNDSDNAAEVLKTILP